VYLEIGAVGAVDEDVVAHQAPDRDGVVLAQRAVRADVPVLDDQRDVVAAVGARQPVGNAVIDDPHAGQSAVDVDGGVAMRVRVVPQRRRRLIDRPRRSPH